MKIEQQFEVRAPADQVWQFLLDPARVVQCLDGAQFEGADDDRHFRGSLKMKVGPISVTYVGTVELTEVDESAGRVRMAGKAREKGGAGNVRMTMDGTVAESDGATRVEVAADVQLAGKIVRFGRGMIETVSAEMFERFAARLRDELEGGAPETAPPPDADEPRGAGAASRNEAAKDAPTATVGAAVPESETREELAVLPLLWRSLVRWLRRLLGGASG